MKSYLLIIALSFSLLGCRAKKVVTSVNADATIAVASSQQLTANSQELVANSQQLTTLTTIADNLELTQTHTIWSKPDSSGAQFPIETTVTITNSQKQTANSQQLTANSQQLIANSQELVTNDSIAIATTVQVTKTEKISGGAWKSWASVILSIALIAFLIRIAKRFKFL